jgi:hypothetical protein
MVKHEQGKMQLYQYEEVYQFPDYVLYNMIMSFATPPSQLASRSESIEALGAICEILHITPYRLAGLINMESACNIYRWLNGEVRPSQRYCIRMMRLMQMKALDNVNFNLVGSVEWPEGKIIWKMDKQNDKNQRGIPASKRAVSKGNGSYGVPMAQFLD